MTAVPAPRSLDPGKLRLALVAAAVIGITGRLAYGYGAPFWFDETFSGVIATQPDFAHLLEWCLNELTGPAYYMPLWAWAQVAGSSDTALRLPSLILAMAAPAIIGWKGADDRTLRRYWAILCLLWAPGIAASWDARGYAQLFLLGSVQAIVFVRLIKQPSTGRAAVWSLVSALLLLTHYWSVVPCLAQGAAFVAWHRRAALRCWPAALVFLPVAGWAYLHLPMVLRLTGAGATARPDSWTVLSEVPGSLFGISLVVVMVLAAIAVSGMRYGFRCPPLASAEGVLGLCGLVGVVAVVGLACLQPGFAPRYLTPCIPSFLFALALWLRWAGSRDARLAFVVIATMGAAAVGLIGSAVADPDRDARHVFELDRPSAWLAQGRPKRLVFFWDGAVAARSSVAHLAEVGGFFFKRAGRPIPVDVVRVGEDADPNPVVAAAARDAAVLWIANEERPASRAPHPERYDPGLDCRDFGRGQVTLTACRRR